MNKTTIQVTDDTKRLLDTKKQQHESYNDVVRRLAGDSSGQLWTEAEIRDMIRDEIRSARR